jgi:hypothetical protein
MIDERETPQIAADSEALVSRTYREAAHNGAPEHLDRAVLRKAASAARPRYARIRAWTRPTAWAATVVLSVALVLEVTKIPAPEDVSFDKDLGEFEMKAPEPEIADDLTTGVLEESVPPETPSGQTSNVTVDAASQLAPSKTMATEATPEAAVENRQRLDSRAIRAKAAASPELSADEFTLSDRDILRRAEDMARVQSENDTQAAPASAADNSAAGDVAALGAAALNLGTSGCEASARDKPETWLECIAKLEEAGLDDEANRQREMLREAFPDFGTR